MFKKWLGFTLPKDAVEATAFGHPGAIEKILKLLRAKLAQYQANKYSAHTEGRESQHNHTGSATKRPVSGLGPAPKATTTSSDQYGLYDVSATMYRPLPDTTTDHETGLISSYHATEPTATAAATVVEEINEVRALNQILEVKSAKLEQLLRLKDAKIAALTARLQGAGLLVTSPPASPSKHVYIV